MPALAYDGSQNYVSLGTMGTFGSSLGSGLYCRFTIKTTYAGSAANIFGTVSTGTTMMLASAIVTGGNLELRYRDNTGKELSGRTPSAPIIDGAYHIVEITATPNTNTIVFKIDGVTTATTYVLQQTPVTFANFGFAMAVAAWNLRGVIGQYHACTISNFQIGISPTNLFGNYRDASQLGTGTVLADNSGKGNNGTLTKGAGAYPTWVNGSTADSFEMF